MLYWLVFKMPSHWKDLILAWTVSYINQIGKLWFNINILFLHIHCITYIFKFKNNWQKLKQWHLLHISEVRNHLKIPNWVQHKWVCQCSLSVSFLYLYGIFLILGRYSRKLLQNMVYECINPIKLSPTWKEISQFPELHALQHIKTNSPKIANSVNAHYWGYMWGHHTQR